MPLPRRGDQGFQILILGIPLQVPFDAFTRGHQHRGIAWPARTFNHRHCAARDLLHRANNFAYRKALTAAEIIRGGGSASRQRIQGKNVSIAEIIDMDVIADTGTIRSGVVCAENLYMLSLTKECLEYNRDKVRFGLMILTNLAGGVCTRGVEVS